MSTASVYGDLTPAIREWAADHGGRVDTGDLAKALAEAEPERYPSRNRLACAIAKRTGRMDGCVRLAVGLYKVREGSR